MKLKRDGKEQKRNCQCIITYGSSHLSVLSYPDYSSLPAIQNLITHHTTIRTQQLGHSSTRIKEILRLINRTGIFPRCIAPKTFHPACEVVLIAPRPVIDTLFIIYNDPFY